MAPQKSLIDYIQRIVYLTTTSEIRYEGRLVSFDPGNSSITLQDVRKLGTEGRMAPIQVEPETKKYAFIVFHHKGIKNLTLKAVDSVDPAILSMSEHNIPQMPRQQHSNISFPPNQSNIRNVNVRNLLRNGGRNTNGYQKRDQSRDRRHRDERHPSRGDRHVSFSVSDSKRSESRGRMSHIPHVPRSSLGRYNDHKKKDQSRRSVTLSQPGKFSKPKKTEKFTEEFDFDKELQKFDKLSLSEGAQDSEKKQEDQETNDQQTKEIYNSEKSFFDNLTPMSKSEEPKRTRKDEKQANRETFGVGQIRPKMKFSDRRFHGKFNLRFAHRRATEAM